MSSFSIIHDASLELRRRIAAALEATPDTDFGLGGSSDRIRVAPPGDDLPDNTLAALFLYHIDIERHLRSPRLLPDRQDPSIQRRAPLPLQLRYLLVPVDDDDTVNQLVIGRVLQHFNDLPFISVLDGEPMDDSYGAASPEMRIKPEMLSLEQLSQLWNALSTPFRLSVGLLVDVAVVDSGLAPRQIPRVNQLVPATGLATED